MGGRGLSRYGRFALAFVLSVLAICSFAAGWGLSRPAGAPEFHCGWTREHPCVAVGGRLLRAERADTDGDGDRHLVLMSRSSLTTPGISVVKVPRYMGLDVARLHFGTWVTAQGYVYRGTRGLVELYPSSLRVGRR